jgi:hypothetical protein
MYVKAMETGSVGAGAANATMALMTALLNLVKQTVTAEGDAIAALLDSAQQVAASGAEGAALDIYA